MGITGELVRSVFLKRQDNSHASSNGLEKRKWSTSVRSYLCGDEHNSVLATDDSASVRSSTVAGVASFESNRLTNIRTGGRDITSFYAEDDTASLRSSEATVNQPLHVGSKDEKPKEKLNSTYRLFQQEDAAVIIQSAFRSFLARRARDEAKTAGVKHGPTDSPSRESIGTSVEVQTGNSSDIFSIKEETFNLGHNIRYRTLERSSQVLKIQEDWDDSTVSSAISKMRMQNRLEAATRRERALAYAFSQQLRICSKKKQSMANGDETNKGWSWLERWMAARQPEVNLTMADGTTSSHKTLARKRMLDAAMEEKESCGSNDVSSLIDLSVPNNVARPAKNRIKARRSFTRQNSASSHLCPRVSEDMKKVCRFEDEKETRKRQKQPGNKRDVKNATTHEAPLVNDF